VYHLVIDAESSVVPGEEIQGLYWQMECEVLRVPGVVVHCPANHQNPNRQVELEGIGRGSVLRISSEDDRECQVFGLARIFENFCILDPVDDADNVSTLLVEFHIVVVIIGVDSVNVHLLSIENC